MQHRLRSRGREDDESRRTVTLAQGSYALHRHAADRADGADLHRRSSSIRCSRRSICRSSRSTRRRWKATGWARQLRDHPRRRRTFWCALWTTMIWTVGTLTLQIVFGVAMALLLNHEHLVPLARAQPGAVPLFRLDRGRGAGLALAVQRPLRHPQPPHDPGRHSSTCRSTGSARCRTPWSASSSVGAWKYLPLRGHRRAGAAADHPEQLYEAAHIDGAGAWSRFWDVTLPQLRDVLIDRHPAAHHLGLQGVRPHLPADRRRAGRPHADAAAHRLPAGLRPQPDGHGRRPMPWR